MVSIVVAELEANLPIIAEQHIQKALRIQIDLYSMPETHPLILLVRCRGYKRFALLIQRIAESTYSTLVKELEATRLYMSALQDTYLDIVNNVDEGVQAAVQAQQTLGIYITTSASTRNQLVGIRHGHNMAIIAIYCNTPIYCNYNNMKVASSATIWAIMTLQYIVIYCNIRSISHVTVDLTISGQPPSLQSAGRTAPRVQPNQDPYRPPNLRLLESRKS